MFRVTNGMWTIGIPMVLSLISVIKHSIVFFVLFILAHFLILQFVPAFKHYENIWMFVIVVFSSIPINVYLLNLLTTYEMLFNSFLLLDILKCILYYISLLSIEEILMGIITRCIWKRQYKDIM